MRASKEDLFSISRRISVSFYLAFIIFLLLILRLYYLQGIYGHYYRDMSENNRRRTVRTIPPRGDIYDRDGRVLVRNRPSFDIAVMKEDISDLESVLNLVSKISETSVGQLKKNLNKSLSRSPFVPQVILQDVSREILARIKANSFRLPGVIVRAVPARVYPESERAAQVLGYVREISRSQLDADTFNYYRPADLIGQAGVEKEFEEVIRGEPGYLQVEVDARGNRRSELSIVNPKKGQDLYLTIDLDLQKIAEDSLGEFSGVVVAVDPSNGEVLALASKPTYDLSIFSGAMRLEDWRKVSQDKSNPLRNRAISNHYPPGSTVKLLFAAFGLAEGVIKNDTFLNCPGYYSFAGRRYHCHKRSGHGRVDVARAIRVSCNAFFYQVGQKLGIDNIFLYGDMFGYGQKTGIELANEDAGVLPSDAWKIKNIGERWYPGETLSVAIGQGFFVVTPIQQAMALSAMVNGGELFRPTLVKDNTQNRLVRRVSIPSDILKSVSEFAEGVVQHKEGTGHRAAFKKIRVGGKTGTAQVGSLKLHNKEEFEDHAWFVGFAPAEDPKIVVITLVEHGGHGGVTAAPVARNVMDVYLKKLGFDTSDEEEEDEGV